MYKVGYFAKNGIPVMIVSLLKKSVLNSLLSINHRIIKAKDQARCSIFRVIIQYLVCYFHYIF